MRVEDWPPPVGAKLRTTFGNELDKLYHVRGHVDGQIVVRWWRRGKQSWEYEVLNQSWWRIFRHELGVSVPRQGDSDE